MKSAVSHAMNWAVQQWNNYQSRTSYHASPLGGYSGGYHSPSSSQAYVQQQQAQARAQDEQRRQQKISDEYRQATGLKSTPKTREGKNLFRNWGKALVETLKHVCNPKTAKAKDKAITKLTVSESFKKEVNKLDYEELTKKYKGLISAQHSYQGTGYGYIVRSPKQLLEDQFVMKRYRELKAKEDAKIAQQVADFYGATDNYFAKMKATGIDPNTGKIATPAQMWASNNYGWIKSVTNIAQIGTNIAFANQAYKQYYGQTKVNFNQQKPTDSAKAINSSTPQVGSNLHGMADEIGNLYGGSVSQARTGKGYTVTIPYKGSQKITVRFMGEGSGDRTSPYYRVSIGNKGSVDITGAFSSDRGSTHINISPNSVIEIKQIINQYIKP